MATQVQQRVERVLEQQGRSVAWLARMANVDPSYAWRMLSGERPLTADFRTAAAKALGVPEDILFAETPAEAAS